MKRKRNTGPPLTFYFAWIRTRFTINNAVAPYRSEHSSIRRVLYRQSIRLASSSFIVIDILPGRFDWEATDEWKIETTPTYVVAAFCGGNAFEKALLRGLRASPPNTERNRTITFVSQEILSVDALGQFSERINGEYVRINGLLQLAGRLNTKKPTGIPSLVSPQRISK